MATSAKSLQPVWVPYVLSRLALQRRDVIALQSARTTAHDAAPVVSVEHGEAYRLPAALIKSSMVFAHRVSPAIPFDA